MARVERVIELAQVPQGVYPSVLDDDHSYSVALCLGRPAEFSAIGHAAWPKCLLIGVVEAKL